MGASQTLPDAPRGSRRLPRGSQTLPESPGGFPDAPRRSRRFPEGSRMSVPRVRATPSRQASTNQFRQPETPRRSRRVPKDSQTLPDVPGNSQSAHGCQFRVSALPHRANPKPTPKPCHFRASALPHRANPKPTPNHVISARPRYPIAPTLNQPQTNPQGALLRNQRPTVAAAWPSQLPELSVEFNSSATWASLKKKTLNPKSYVTWVWRAGHKLC